VIVTWVTRILAASRCQNVLILTSVWIALARTEHARISKEDLCVNAQMDLISIILVEFV